MSNVSKLFNQLNNRVEWNREVKIKTLKKLPSYLVNIRLLFIPEMFNIPSHLKRINMKDCVMELVIFLQLNLTNIESLNFPDIYLSNDEDIVINHIKSFVLLKQLSIKIHNLPIQFIKELSHLKSLKIEFDDTEVDDYSADTLSKMQNIKEIKFFECSFKHGVLKQLKRLKHLNKLSLINCDINDFEAIGKVKIKKLRIYNKKSNGLNELKLSNSSYDHIHISDLKELKYLKKLKIFISIVKPYVNFFQEILNVEKLSLLLQDEIPISELHHLVEIKNLKTIEILSTRSSVVKNLKCLKHLKIQHSYLISDDELMEMIQMTEIKKLTLKNYSFPKTNIEHLRSQLQNVKIKLKYFQ
jgi:hypothetical protein